MKTLLRERVATIMDDSRLNTETFSRWWRRHSGQIPWLINRPASKYAAGPSSWRSTPTTTTIPPAKTYSSYLTMTIPASIIMAHPQFWGSITTTAVRPAHTQKQIKLATCTLTHSLITQETHHPLLPLAIYTHALTQAQCPGRIIRKHKKRNPKIFSFKILENSARLTKL